jgi:hypothetical protein
MREMEEVIRLQEQLDGALYAVTHNNLELQGQTPRGSYSVSPARFPAVSVQQELRDWGEGYVGSSR